eukprot:SAG11_NODE_9012_length_953_cov_2.117096_1_plen_65_part_00
MHAGALLNSKRLLRAFRARLGRGRQSILLEINALSVCLARPALPRRAASLSAAPPRQERGGIAV